MKFYSKEKTPKKYCSSIIMACIAMACLTFLSGCKKESAQMQETYLIKMGATTFEIPADYLVDSRDRKNQEDKYTILVGKLPEILPLQNGRNYKRSPDSSPQTMNLILHIIKWQLRD